MGKRRIVTKILEKILVINKFQRIHEKTTDVLERRVNVYWEAGIGK